MKKSAGRRSMPTGQNRFSISRLKMHFRSEYSMKGWRSGLTIMAGALFIVIGTAASLGTKVDNAPQRLFMFFSAIFCGGGIAVIAYGIHAHRSGIRYALEVRDNAIRWGRADIPREAGRIDLREIREIVHTRSPEDESLHAIDSAGIRHSIPLGYMDGSGAVPKLLQFIETHYPAIRIRS